MKNRTLYRIYLTIASLVLILVTAGCGFFVKAKVVNIKTGPEQTVDVQVPLPADTSKTAALNLEFVAGKLNLAPGADGALASGSATFNAVELEPKLESGELSYTLQSGTFDMNAIPLFKDDIKNVWDLKLSSTPMSLDIKAGAYEGTFELGGLSLEKFSVSEGGSDCKVNFSTPNKVEMSSLTYSTGGSQVFMKGLANANFTQMTFSSGAGDYTLSFDGELKRDASVKIETGMSTTNIIVPAGVNAKLTFEGGMTTINAGGGWVQNDKVYTHSGSGPTITMTVTMGVGTLNLKTE